MTLLKQEMIVIRSCVAHPHLYQQIVERVPHSPNLQNRLTSLQFEMPCDKSTGEHGPQLIHRPRDRDPEFSLVDAIYSVPAFADHFFRQTGEMRWQRGDLGDHHRNVVDSKQYRKLEHARPAFRRREMK